jgi:hypothetical protein
VGVPPRRDRTDFANPTLEQMARHWFDSFCTNPSAESFADSLSLSFFILQVGGMERFLLIDSGCSRHMTRDRRLVLQPHPGDDQRVHHFFGQWERQSAFSGHGEGE